MQSKSSLRKININFESDGAPFPPDKLEMVESKLYSTAEVVQINLPVKMFYLNYLR